MTQAIFKEQTVTREAILAAMRAFDAQFPDNALHERWLQKQGYKHTVAYARAPILRNGS